MINSKLWISVGVLVAGAFYLSRKAHAAATTADTREPIDPYGPPDSRASVCVSGATGPTACGGDSWLSAVRETVMPPVAQLRQTLASWFQLSTVTKSAEATPSAWTSDPAR